MKIKQNKAITLIALVITIIILLILAGVTIATLTGENGIIKRVGNAKNSTENAQITENTTLTKYENYISDYLGNGDGDGNGNGQGASLNNLTNIDTTKSNPAGSIPASAIKQVIETHANNGIVIKDVNDNEWVWVEVPKNIYTDSTYTASNGNNNVTSSTDYEGIYNILNAYALTYRRGNECQGRYWQDEWYDGSNVIGYVKTTIADETAYETAVAAGTLYINKAGIQATTGRYTSDKTYYVVNTSATLTNTTGCGLSCSDYTANYKKMLTSVYTNGGFWIARYEAGIAGSDTNISLVRGSHSNITSTSVKAVSQKNMIPYNFVYCREAQFLANNITPDSSKTSSLMFGIQWDLVCKFLEVNVNWDITTNTASYYLNTKSSSWGNYSDSSFNIDSTNAKKYSTLESITGTKSGSLLLTTGASEYTNKMNIYDFAGNEIEWTLEHVTTNSIFPCSGRGGYYNNNSSSLPASHRNGSGAVGTSENHSFRSTFY